VSISQSRLGRLSFDDKAVRYAVVISLRVAFLDSSLVALDVLVYRCLNKTAALK
jgi:hypothetical protein